MSCGIYKIENLLNNKCYIGQSIDIEQRWLKHKSAKDDFLIHKALRKYGIENFIFEILVICDQNELNAKECEYIKKYNSLIPNGYNMIQGGSNGAGISKSKKIFQYDLAGNFIAEYLSAKQASEIMNISHGNICSCCRGERNYAGGYQWRYENDKRPLKHFETVVQIKNKKVIQQVDINNGNIINEYPTLSAAGKDNAISIGNIGECCQGKRKTAGGFKWVKKIIEEKKEIIKEIKGE